MTRQEIEERAAAAASDLRDECGWPTEAEQRLERHLTTLAVATLEEAARSGCQYCRQCHPVRKVILIGYVDWRHDLGGDLHLSASCARSEIHDLIAALKGEGA